MNRIKAYLSLILLVVSTNVCLSQTTRFGVYFSPEFNLPLQRTNDPLVSSVDPKIGFTTGGVVAFDLNDNWTIRTGLGFTKSRYSTPKGLLTFESDIDPTLGFRTHTDYVFNSIDLPFLLVYRKPESIIGGFVGFDLTAFSNQNVEQVYSHGSIKESQSFISFNPSVNLGMQFRFELGDGPSVLMLEPYTRYYLRSTGASIANLLSTGLRLVYLRPF